MAIPDEVQQIPKRPCNEQQVADAISQIVNVFNTYNTTIPGSIQAECTLTNDTMPSDCVPADYAVSNFAPRWDSATLGPLPLPTPSRADNWLDIPLFGSKSALIGYSWVTNTWRVDDIALSQKVMVTGITQTSNKGFNWTFESVGVNGCDVQGDDDFLISTVVQRVMRSFEGLGCTLYGHLYDVEVFDSDAVTDPEIEVTFDVEVDVLWNLYYTDGVIYGSFMPMFVPCIGDPYALALIETEVCTSGSG